MEETDVDIANAKLEDKIKSIMDKFAPMRTIQVRQNYKSWISNET